MSEVDQVRLTIWSDYVCPFCYLELPAVDAVQREFGSRVAVEWKAFELRPEPEPTLDPAGEYLQSIWSRAVYPMAKQVGIEVHLPPVQPRSRMALEMAALAKVRGHFNETHRALFRGFFEQGLDIGRRDVLRAIGEASGLDGHQLEEALVEGRFSDEVRRDRELALRLGISGVPATVIGPADTPVGEGYLLSGAVPGELLKDAVERVLRG